MRKVHPPQKVTLWDPEMDGNGSETIQSKSLTCDVRKLKCLTGKFSVMKMRTTEGFLI